MALIFVCQFIHGLSAVRAHSPLHVRDSVLALLEFRLFTKGEAERRGVFRPKGVSKGIFAFSLVLSLRFRGGFRREVVYLQSKGVWLSKLKPTKRRTRKRAGDQMRGD